MALPAGSGASAALQTALNPYLSDSQPQLVVLSGPAGSVTGDPNLPNNGFSYVFKLSKGVSDLKDRTYGWRNVGHVLGHTADGKPTVAGELRGWLGPVVGADAGITYSFSAADYPTYDTKATQTTTVTSAPIAPQDLAVDVLRSTAASGNAAGMVLDVPGASTTGGQKLAGAPETDLPGQRWLLKASSTAAGYFHLVNITSGLCLDITGPWPPNGTGALVQFRCDSTASQQWKNQLWKPVGQTDGSYTLVTDIDQRSVATLNNDGTLGVAGDTGAAGQRWAFAPMTATLQPNAIGVLSSALGPALELAGGPVTTGVPGTKIVAATETDQTTQQWLVLPTGNPGGYPGTVNLVNVKTAQCLSVPVSANGQADPKAQPDQETCAPNYDHPRQLWTSHTQPGGSYTLVNAQTHLALTVTSAAARQLKGARPKPRRAKHRRPGHRRLKSGQAPSTQSMWFTSRKVNIKDGYPATGSQDFLCSDYVPAGRTNLFPYLVPEGSSYAYHNISGSGKIHIAANLLASTPLTGKLSTLWSNYNTRGDWALQIQQQCTGQNPDGWSVSSLGPKSLSITTATLQAQLSGFSGKVTAHVDYGTGAASYNSHSPDQNVTGNSVSLSLTGLQPNTTYHYRIVAANTSFTETPNAYSGADQTFTTPDYGYGTPVAQAVDTGAAAQRFVFRPLATTLTTQVGNTSYHTQMPVSWSGFAVLGLDPSLTATPGTPMVFYTNTGDATTDGENQADMAAELSALQNQPDKLVMVQSINAPKPTTPNWNQVTSQIQALGGIPQVFDALNGSGDYALVGCGDCGSNAAEASVATGTASQDHLSGNLHRDAQSSFNPLLSNTADLTTSNLYYSLLPLAYATPAPWPIPPGVTPEANAAVLTDIANQLQLTAQSCYAYPAGEPDVRSTYCDIQVAWGAKYDSLRDSAHPSGETTLDCTKPVSDQLLAARGYSDADWCGVRGELLTEFNQLDQLAKEIQGFQTLFNNGSSLVQNAVTKGANGIENLMNTTPSANASGNAVELVASGLGLLSELSGVIPGAEAVGTVLGAVSEMIYVGSAATAQTNGSLNLSDFQTDVGDFADQANDRLKAAANGFGVMFNLLAQDPTKLATVSGYGGNKWQLDSNSEPQFNAKLVQNVKAELNTVLIPAYYSRYTVQVPGGEARGALNCPLAQPNGSSTGSYPLQKLQDSAALNPVSGIGAGGQPQQTDTWFLASGKWPINSTDAGLQILQAKLTDPLFTPPASGGFGLNKTVFFTSLRAGPPNQYCYYPKTSRRPPQGGLG
jgi:Ricin-type beta-trefoil lectin domain-like